MSAPELTAVPASLRQDEASYRFRWHLSDIGRQSSVSLAGTIFTMVVGYVFRVYLARELGPRLLGWNALGIGLYSVCKLLGEVGLPAAALRYAGVYSASADNRLSIFFWRSLFWTLAGTCALASIVTLGRYWISLRLFHDLELSRYLPLYALLIPVGAASSFLVQMTSGLRMVARATFVTRFISFPFMVISTVLALAFGWSLWGYIAAQVAGEILTLCLIAAMLWRSRFVHFPGTGIAQGLDSETRCFAASMLGMGLLTFLGGHADRLILGFYLSAKQVGIYAIASSAAALNVIFLQAVNSIFAPTIASLHQQGEHDLLLRLYQTLTKWIIAFSLPLIFVFLIFSRTIMGLFGADFQVGWLILAIVTLGELVNCATGSVGYLLLMSGNQNSILRVRLVLAGLLTLANLALIPHFGVTAAAVVSATGTILSNIAYLAIVRWRLQLFPYNRSYLKLFAPSSAALLLLLILHAKIASGVSAILVLCAAASLAAAVLLGGFACFGLSDDDRFIVDIVKCKLASWV